jgi:hypothetical protein
MSDLPGPKSLVIQDLGKLQKAELNKNFKVNDEKTKLKARILNGSYY